MRLQSQSRAGLRRVSQLLRCPCGPGGGVVAYLGRRECAELFDVRGMHSKKLPLQMRGKFGDLDTMPCKPALDLIAIGLALRRLPQIEQGRVGCGHLYADVAQRRSPLRHAFQGIERRLRTCKLGQEDGGAFHGDSLPVCGSSRHWLPAAELATVASTNAMPRNAALIPGTVLSAPAPDSPAISRANSR